MVDERLGYRLVPEFTPEFEEPAQTLAGQAHAAIRKRILTADLAPGSLINERALMEDMDFGRTPVREALLRLASEKLVIFRANQAIQVAPIGFEEVRELYACNRRRSHHNRVNPAVWVGTVDFLAANRDEKPVRARHGGRLVVGKLPNLNRRHTMQPENHIWTRIFKRPLSQHLFGAAKFATGWTFFGRLEDKLHGSSEFRPMF